MKNIAREARDLFLGPVDGDPFEQFVPRLCSVLLALTGPVAYVVRGWLA